MKPYWKTLVLLVLAMGVVSSVELAIPKLIEHFIDVIVPEERATGVKTEFLLLIGILAAALGLMFGASVLENLSQRQLQEKAARDLQYSMFRHLRKLGFSYFEKRPIGETLSFLNTEVAEVQKLYRQGFPWMINGIVFSAISIGVMVATSVQLTLIVLPSFLLYYIFGPKLERLASVYGKQLAQDRIAEQQKVYESISSLAELRAHGSEAWDMERYQAKVDTHNASFLKMFWYAYLRGSNRRMSYYIGGIVIFVYGYYLFVNNELAAGQFVAFTLYYFAAMHRLTAVVTNITEQKVLMYQAQRLYEFMQTEPDIREPEVSRELKQVRGELCFHDVVFGYEGKPPVLQGLSFTVPAGTRAALVGTSGNGKSTILKLAGRFYDPQEGRITLDGVPVDELSLGSLRNALGYVFQETYLFGASIRENIRFGCPEASDEEVVQAAKAAYADSFIRELPEGYDTVVGERGVKLSGGQRQRIAIARMYMKNPAVVLLDEATSALDNVSEAEVQQALDTLLSGRTILTVAHRLSTIKDYDEIFVLDGGRVVESGTYEALLAAKGVFYSLAKEESSDEQRQEVG
ncbi:ABC transporter ATP-binding protein [Paenibacillus turpanensis]|uniref:ABC transporter ATP-binding protein n=1 Tax=Paenibacillus turpanensis TaxID=2689078 RepID=UPI00140E87C5|nr:ABC transporter ATP-binding protein [Paenibacillus turpanensis]